MLASRQNGFDNDGDQVERRRRPVKDDGGQAAERRERPGCAENKIKQGLGKQNAPEPAAEVKTGHGAAAFGDRVTLVHGSYATLGDVLAAQALPAPAGILLDVGVSSLQLDDPSRGFSFKGDDALPDMAANPQLLNPFAAEALNGSPPGET